MTPKSRKNHDFRVPKPLSNRVRYGYRKKWKFSLFLCPKYGFWGPQKIRKFLKNCEKFIKFRVPRSVGHSGGAPESPWRLRSSPGSVLGGFRVDFGVGLGSISGLFLLDFVI